MTLDVVSGCHMGTRTTFSHSSTAHTGAILHGCLVHPAPATWLRQPCSKHAVRGSSQAAGGVSPVTAARQGRRDNRKRVLSPAHSCTPSIASRSRRSVIV